MISARASFLFLSVLALLVGGCSTRIGNPKLPTASLAVELGPNQNNAVTRLSLCITQLSFVPVNGGAPVDAELGQGVIDVTSSSTPLISLTLPGGDYERVQAQVSSTCNSGKSVELTNPQGAYSIQDSVKVAFHGAFSANGSLRSLTLDLKPIIAELMAINSAPQIKSTMESVLGDVILGNDQLMLWTGRGGNTLWSNPGNWVNGVVPTSSDVAYFDSSCLGTCDVTIDVPITVYGIEMDSGFPGTITQFPGKTIALRYYGWVQKSGNFVGSDAAINIIQYATFTLSGGVFTSTSGVLNLSNQLKIEPGATFNANGGILEFGFSNSTSYTIYPNSTTFNGVHFNAGGGSHLTIDGTLNATDVSIDLFLDMGRVTGGIVNISGNLNVIRGGHGGDTLFRFVGSGNQTWSCLQGGHGAVEINKPSGALTISGTCNGVGPFTYVSGNVNAAGSTIGFSSALGQDFTVTPGAMEFDNVVFNQLFRTTTVNGSMVINGNLVIDEPFYNVGPVSGGTSAVKGNVSGLHLGVVGNASLLLNGTGNQILTAPAGLLTGGTLTINKASGSVALATDLSLSASGQDLTISNGTLNMSGHTLSVNDALSNGVACTINQGGGTMTYGTLVNNGTINP